MVNKGMAHVLTLSLLAYVRSSFYFGSLSNESCVETGFSLNLTLVPGSPGLYFTSWLI